MLQQPLGTVPAVKDTEGLGLFEPNFTSHTRHQESSAMSHWRRSISGVVCFCENGNLKTALLLT